MQYFKMIFLCCGFTQNFLKNETRNFKLVIILFQLFKMDFFIHFMKKNLLTHREVKSSNYFTFNERFF